MAHFAEQVPEHCRVCDVGPMREPYLVCTREAIVLWNARLHDARKIAFDIGSEHRHARVGEPLRQHLQRYSLACSCRPGDQTVTAGEFKLEVLRLDAAAKEYVRGTHEPPRYKGSQCA